MIKLIAKRLIICLLFVICYGCITFANTHEEGIWIEAYTSKTEIKVGESVDIGYTIHNTSEQDLVLRKRHIVLEFINGNSKSAERYPNDKLLIDMTPEELFMYQIQPVFQGIIEIGPGQKHVETIQFVLRKSNLNIGDRDIVCYSLVGPEFDLIIGDSNQMKLRAGIYLNADYENKLESAPVKIDVLSS